MSDATAPMPETSTLDAERAAIESTLALAEELSTRLQQAGPPQSADWRLARALALSLVDLLEPMKASSGAPENQVTSSVACDPAAPYRGR